MQRCSSRPLDGTITHLSFLPLLSSIIAACDSARSFSNPHQRNRKPLTFFISPTVALFDAADLSLNARVSVPDNVTCMTCDPSASPFVFLGTDGGAVLVLDCRW